MNNGIYYLSILFIIILLDPPTISKPARLDVKEGDKAVLKCNVKANPLTKEHVTWIREKYDFTKTKQDVKGEIIFMIIRDPLTLFSTEFEKYNK